MELQGKRVLVIGAARSGLAAAEFLLKHGAATYLNDLKKDEQIPGESLEPLKKLGIILVLGRHASVEEIRPDIVIVSPGVPFDAPPLLEAKNKHIPVWSEMEFASRFTKAPMVAVTGTNGKTTTTSLLGQIFSDSGISTFVGGNIGVPFILKAEEMGEEDVAVLELSSFQLETTDTFKPRVSLILNITPDHIDRHGTYEGYIDAKAKIFANQDNTDWLILNANDPETRKLAERANTRVLFFSSTHNLNEGFCVHDGYIIARIDGKTTEIIKTDDLMIKGSHNLENALAAVGAAWVMGIGAETLAHSLRTFPGVPHRLEPVLTHKGVLYINDSKGTNPDASIKALEAYNNPIILIAGGKSKGSDFLPFAERINMRVKQLVLVGQAAGEIEEAIKKVGYTRYHCVQTFRDAVNKAAELASEGDIVLLSPACASFDMFNSYEHRGDVFKELVRELAGKK